MRSSPLLRNEPALLLSKDEAEGDRCVLINKVDKGRNEAIWIVVANSIKCRFVLCIAQNVVVDPEWHIRRYDM